MCIHVEKKSEKEVKLEVERGEREKRERQRQTDMQDLTKIYWYTLVFASSVGSGNLIR